MTVQTGLSTKAIHDLLHHDQSYTETALLGGVEI